MAEIKVIEVIEPPVSVKLTNGVKGDQGKSIVSASFVDNDIVFVNDENEDIVIEGGKTALQGSSAYQVWVEQGNEGTVEEYLESLKGEVTNASLNEALGNKVDKVEGKGLSTNDYTNVEKNKVSKNENRSNGTRKCIVSFLTDDGRTQDYTILKPIFEAQGIACSGALITNGSQQLTDTQVQELISLGWDFGSHTVNHYSLSSLTNTQIEYELFESKKAIESRGINCEYIVYPFGDNNASVREIAQKYYKYAFSTNGAINDYPIKTYQINRVSVGSYFDGVGKDTLTYYKSMFDSAYAKGTWVIFMLHSSAPEFNATQQQYLNDLIDYIKTFTDVEILTVTKAYKKIGNMIAIGDGTNEKLVITNAGDIFENNPVYSNELSNTSNSFKTGTGTGQTTPVDFVDGGQIKISMIANASMTNPSIISVGKNLLGGLKFAREIINAVGNQAYAYYTVVDGRRCLALVGNGALVKALFSNGFITGNRYVMKFTWRRADSATGTGGRFAFRYSDGTQTNASGPLTTIWTEYSFGSVSGKNVVSIYGDFGGNGQTSLIDIDTFQLEVGISPTTFESYKETRLDVTASLVANDVLRFENGKLYKNAELVSFTNNLKAFRNGHIYVTDNSSPIIKVTYPLNRKAVQDIIST